VWVGRDSILRPLLTELAADFGLAIRRTSFALGTVGARFIISLLLLVCVAAWGSFTRVPIDGFRVIHPVRFPCRAEIQTRSPALPDTSEATNSTSPGVKERNGSNVPTVSST
jgi:hypothetical protein